MLDSDASFFLVPEFQSSHGARRSRSAPSSDLVNDAAQGTEFCLPPLSDAGAPGITAGVAALAAFGFPSASFMPEEARIAADFSRTDGVIAPVALPILADAPSAGGESRADDIMDAGSDSLFLESGEDTAALPTEARAITPRRPMRFTFARETPEPGRIALPAPNLFDGVFDSNTLSGADIDPRLQRSRARALARLAAHEATLPPEARNLWHDDGAEPDAPLAATEATETAPAVLPDATPPAMTMTAPESVADPSTATPAAPVTPRRAVRQIAVTRRTPRPRPEIAAIHDPLQDHLHQIRDALYAPLPDTADAAEATATSPIPARAPILARLVALIMALAVMRTLLTLHRALTRPRAPRFPALLPALRRLMVSPLRLPARAAAITALILVLAQTVPRDLM
ncbi:hypothetical protein [Paragemmobacter ruber]|uniref:Uncharacterized protein n=1 Tax=Paragemmobacter ruber TaxID=1985673 RepID=A0ABW9Y9K1_9RHOB|nr:hypothetical protein [Rhodobacter ruber]NBE08711.1 hypothetical protein [Rhodobacter ruber]